MKGLRWKRDEYFRMLGGVDDSMGKGKRGRGRWRRRTEMRGVQKGSK